ncbi:MAG: hypothetical protein ACQESR_28590 [Planctomycetota bacterium]
MGPVELAEWTVGNRFLEILDVFGGRIEKGGKIEWHCRGGQIEKLYY